MYNTFKFNYLTDGTVDVLSFCDAKVKHHSAFMLSADIRGSLYMADLSDPNNGRNFPICRCDYQLFKLIPVITSMVLIIVCLSGIFRSSSSQSLANVLGGIHTYSSVTLFRIR